MPRPTVFADTFQRGNSDEAFSDEEVAVLQQGHATEDPVAAEEGRVMTADSAVAPDDRAVVDPDRHDPAEPAAVGPEDPWAWTDKSPTAAPATTRWGYSWGQALIVLAGVASLVFGIGAVALAGLAGSVTAPVVQVFTYSHTPLLGLIEIGAGLALVLTGLVPGGRWVAGPIAVGAIVGGALIVAELDWIQKNLAAEQRFGWIVIAIGAVAYLGAMVPTRKRVVAAR
jgi:hypothetical protein